MERPVKSAEESRTERTHILFPRSLNNQGRLFGGELLGWIAEAARWAGQPAGKRPAPRTGLP